jgi:tetratricopeptide (TPR) repeat protein
MRGESPVRSSLPVFLGTSRTPTPSGVGITIVGPELPCVGDGNTAWIHGALVLDPKEAPPEARAAWIQSLFLTTIDRDDQFPLLASLIKDRRHFQDHTVESELPDGTKAALLPFNFDIVQVLGGEIPPLQYYVHVSARHYRSNVLLIQFQEEGTAPHDGPFPTETPPQTPADWLLQAYAMAQVGMHADAVAAFEKALEEPAVRGDLDRGNLYHAACEACRIAGDGVDEERRIQQALDWLAEDLRRRREFLEREFFGAFDAELQGTLPPGAADRVTCLLEETAAHFRRARRQQEAFKILHELPDFEALFQRVVD